MFKNVFEKLIGKMMNKEVWDCWYLTSQSGKKMDPDLKELRKPWADPVCKENIMARSCPIIWQLNASLIVFFSIRGTLRA